mgnify:CR=1 FL=1
MKKSLLIISILAFSALGFSQTTDLGGPISWKNKVTSIDKIPFQKMPGFDLAAIQAEDATNDLDKSIPWRFGYKYATDINLSNSGEWIDMPNGKLWRLGLECEGAQTINLLLENYTLPEGARLYLFDINKTNRVGAYTSRNNRADGLLGTELVHGDKIVVEYYEPNAVSGQGSFSIKNIIHGYRSLDKVQEDLNKALNSSGDCNIDVNCPLGIGWDNQIRSVAMIVVGGSGVCTGALINNTCNDGTPYFLTADHCLGGSTGNWAFRFNWKSPIGTESCATTANSVDPGPPYDETANGATVLANSGNSDFALLEIDNMTLSDAIAWNLFYAGWNNDDTENLVTEITGIHHPSGDVMKICQADDGAGADIFHAVNGGAETWELDSWEEGVTEPGSSGSPLFDQNGRIIGQLYGGAAACSGTVNNGQYDYYGRFGISWNLGVSDYLNPASCGGPAVTNDGWDPNGPSDPDNASIQSIQSPEGLLCDDTFTPSVTLRNAGGNDLTSCVINWDIDGGANQTTNWTGLLVPNSSEIVYLPSMTASSGAHTFNASTSSPNGNTDTNPANDASLSNFTIDLAGYETTILIGTDCYGYESAWELQNASSTIIAAGGNSIGIAPGGLQIANSGDPGSYSSESIIEVKLCLAEGCYDFTMYDDWGDGMEANFGCNTDGFYEISNTSSTILGAMQNVAFGDSETINFCVVDNTGLDEFDWLNFNVYPNPSLGKFNLSFNNLEGQTITAEIVDLTGRIILKDEIVNNGSVIDLSNHSNGTYLLTLKSDSFTLIETLIRY